MSGRCINLTDREVRGILDGSITQLRRVVKGSTPIASSQVWSLWWSDKFEAQVKGDGYAKLHGPFGEPGDRLIGRETWCIGRSAGMLIDPCLHYRADGEQVPLFPKKMSDVERDFLIGYDITEKGGWKRPNMMPRWLSRLPLRVKSARVQQLGGVTEVDAKAEGASIPDTLRPDTPRESYLYVTNRQKIWDANAKPGEEWNPNLWTFVAAIEREER